MRSRLYCAVWKVESRWGEVSRKDAKTRCRLQWTDANYEAIKVRGSIGHGPPADLRQSAFRDGDAELRCFSLEILVSSPAAARGVAVPQWSCLSAGLYHRQSSPTRSKLLEACRMLSGLQVALPSSKTPVTTTRSWPWSLIVTLQLQTWSRQDVEKTKISAQMTGHLLCIVSLGPTRGST